MRKILWQISIVDQSIASDTSSAVRMHLKDSTTFRYQRILHENKVTAEEYKKSMDYYQSNPTLMKTLIDTTVDFGKKANDSFKKVYKPKAIKDSSKKLPHNALPVKDSLPAFKKILNPNKRFGPGNVPTLQPPK